MYVASRSVDRLFIAIVVAVSLGCATGVQDAHLKDWGLARPQPTQVSRFLCLVEREAWMLWRLPTERRRGPTAATDFCTETKSLGEIQPPLIDR